MGGVIHKRGKDGTGERQADCWRGDRVVDFASACCGKEAAEPKGKSLDVAVNLHLYLYLWP